MKHPIRSLVALILLVIMPGLASNVFAANLTVGNIQLVNKQRVTQTVYQYTFKADLTNQDVWFLKNVTAQISSDSSTTTIVDGTLSFGDMAGSQTVTSSDTFSIQQDRRYSFDESVLKWDLQWTHTLWDESAAAGTTVVAPGWDLTVTGDIVSGSSYYYVKNDLAAAIISTIKNSNNLCGTLQKGFAADFVSRSINTETLDWTQFILYGSMHANWSVSAQNLALDTMTVNGNAVVASGLWNGDAAITASARYTLLENAPIMKIVLTLTNTSATDFSGYVEYQMDPDGTGNQNAYAPGLGWGLTTVQTSGWSSNYIYDGPTAAINLPAHGIAWYESNPTGILVPGYIFGAWFDASMAAGESKTIVFYHITDQFGSTAEPYSNIAAWASRIAELDPDVTPMGTVTGTITDTSNQAPAAGATVIAKNTLGEVVAKSSTDSNGIYSLAVPVDVYTLTASSLYYEFGSRSVSMTEGQPSVLDFELAPVSVWAGTGKLLSGSLVEAGENAITLVNQKMAMAIAVDYNDSQLSGSTTGKPVDMAIKNLSDGIDWLNLPYLSLNQPSGTEAWQITTVQNSQVQILSQSASQAVVRTSGIYSEVSGVTVVTDYTMNADESWVTAKTTVTNNSGADLTVWIGDVIDNDESGQTSYVPGYGDVTAAYASPAEYTLTSPWIAQYGASEQCYGLIYLGDTTDFMAYGNASWIQSQRQVTIPADQSLSLERLVIVTSTTRFSSKADAIAEIYQNELAGIESSFALDKDVVTTAETTVATLTLTNNSSSAFTACSATLVISNEVQTDDPATVTFDQIAPGSAATAFWTLSGVSGGRTVVTVNVNCNGISFSRNDSIFINGPGWYAGDNHTHSTYSDGTGTIAQNYVSAINKGLTFVTSTDHNSIKQEADVYANSTSTFLGLLGDEVTSSYGHSLAYNIDMLIDQTLAPQQMINQVMACNDGEGLLYIAHPYYPGLEWDDHTVTGYTGIEVWNGFYAPTHSVNTQAFTMWDNFNLAGMHLYGIANSDAHNTGKVSDPHICAWLNSFTREEIIRALGTGTFYGTNGPSLEFSINGVMMGGNVTIGAASAMVTINLSGSYSQELASITLIKNGTILQTWTPGMNSMSETIQDLAVLGDFYRLVVQTANSGYAFSNPIWIVE